MSSPRVAVRRLAVAVAFVSLLVVVPARADDGRETAEPSSPAAALSITEAALAQAVAASAPTQSKPRSSSSTTAAMLSLYAVTVALQMLDAHSTMSALGRGAREANPLMKDIAANKAAMFGVKAAVAGTTILAMHKVSKKNRVAAIITGIAINSAYAVVVAHNYRVGRGLK
jgi:hypothetical protein